MSFYWDKDDKEDQLQRRFVNINATYTTEANCEFCGTPLKGSAFVCEKCKALSCDSCACDDLCPVCAGS